MKIKVFPRTAIANMIQLGKRLYDVESPWALISIHHDQGLFYNFKCGDIIKSTGCQEILTPRFADVTDVDWKLMDGKDKFSDFKLFSEKEANMILGFLDRNKEVETLAVNCAAGVSRSGAVGLFACRYYGLDEEVFRKENKNILPNMYVLRVLTEASGINSDYIKFWEGSF